MTITIANGITSAKKQAIIDGELYNKAVRIFGDMLRSSIGNAPIGLAIGHCVYINRQLEMSPMPSKNHRYGFMRVTGTALNKIGITTSKVDDPDTCSYAWGYDINNTAISFYTKNSSLFSNTCEDFWRSVYVQHLMGDSPFNMLWKQRDITQPTVYASLLNAVEAMQKGIPGFPALALQKLVLVDCEYVYQLGKASGSFQGTGFGKQPPLNKMHTMETIPNGR